MGVDYDAVCFLGWEVTPPEEGENAKPDPHGTGSTGEDAINDMAKEHGLSYGVYGDGGYGGEDYYVLGIGLHGLSIKKLLAAIDELETHPLVQKYGLPQVHGGVHVH